MKSLKFSFTFFSFLFFAAIAMASKPHVQSHSSFTQFQRGTLENISILYDGKLTLAPQKKLLMDSGDPFIWDVVADRQGNIYLATGNDGRIYKISASGDSSLFFDAPELEVYALAMDDAGNLLAATSPNGKVYRISPSGDGKTFFDPNDKYIWDLVFDKDGNLIVATGDSAKIYRVNRQGQSTVLFSSKQKHIRCLALSSKGQLYAGSSGNGYVYKFLANDHPFVLFDTEMEEVHSLVVTPDGNVFAASFGEPSPSIPSAITSKTGQAASAASQQTKSQQQGKEVSLAPQSIIPASLMRAAKTKTSLFKISPNGYGKDLWLDQDDHIQVLKLIDEGELLVGTGNKGKLFQVTADGKISLLLKTEESQITGIFISPKNEIFLGTSNMGRCYRLGNRPAKKGSFISETIDTGILSDWGVLSWEGTISQNQIRFFTRSGNTERPSQTWSEWVRVDKNSDDVYKISSPTARFLQWKCELSGVKTKAEYVDKVSISYLQQNLPPEITAVIIHKPGEYYDVKSNPGTTMANTGQGKSGLVYPQPLTKSEHKKGYRSVDWMFEDPNFDGLKFDLYYRRRGDKRWKLFAKDLQSSVYSWDSSQMSDGEYEIKVVASDAPGNPANLALTAERTSDPFIIDNTGPIFKSVKLRKEGQSQILSFVVTDQWSPISNVSYSINAGEWSILYPVDQICDSKVEHFELSIPNDAEYPIEIAIKAFDKIENVSVLYKSIEGRK